MIDRSIPYCSIFMRCDSYSFQPVRLPVGYHLINYHPGLEKEWARLETAVGDYSSLSAAEEYFVSEFTGKHLDDHIFFIKDEFDRVVGSCIAWHRERDEEKLNLLHWLIVDEQFQGQGLGHVLCQTVMNAFFKENNKPVYLHTQPWSYKAIFLYTKLGFKLEKFDSFPPHKNEYNRAMAVLKNIVTPMQYSYLIAHSEE